MEFNAMMSFQFFCNNLFKQKNIDKLMPKGMARSEWNTKKTQILAEEIESVHRYLEQQALQRLEKYPATDKANIEKRFTDTITSAINNYTEQLSTYYYL